MKRIWQALFLIGIALSFSVLVAGAQEPQPPTLYFSGENALEHVANHLSVGPRPVGTLGSIAAGNLILDHLRAQEGWRTAEDWHMIPLGNRSTLSANGQVTLEAWNPLSLDALVTSRLADTELSVEIDRIYFPVRNLIGSYGEGGTIIIGAHYDSRIFSDKDVDESRRLLPMPGANDGGSGVGVLLELARVLSAHYTPNREIRFVFFDAEDNGGIDPFPALLPSTRGYLIGSTLYANSLNLDNEQIEYMLLLDLVGEYDQQFPIEGYSDRYAPELTRAIWAVAAELGYGEQFPTTVRSPIIDDHVPFIQRGIPAVDIIDLDYAYWDTSEDTLDKISAESLERVGRVVERFLEASGAITRNPSS